MIANKQDGGSEGLVERLASLIASAEKDRGLDRRFSYSAVGAAGPRRVLVELSREEVGSALLDSLEGRRREGEGGITEIEAAGGTIVEYRLLRPPPDRSLWVTASVADIRKEPAHEAELVTQMIMAEHARELKRQGEWILARLADGYHGWICSWSVSEVPQAAIEEYEARADIRVLSNIGYVLSERRAGSIPVSDVVAGCRLVAGDVGGSFREVMLPIDRKGFIKNDDVEAIHAVDPSRSRLIGSAQRFIGVPYMWGGTSAKAFDCSGFVKRVFELEGVELPRDSDLQARVGALIPLEEVGDALPGDLLFFGEGATVRHVGIVMGDDRFIHAYGCVRINSLSEDDSLYEEKLARSLLFGRSVLGRAG